MNKIVWVVDFGSQYNQLIIRRIRELGFYAELVEPDRVTLDQMSLVGALVLSGGPSSVLDHDAPKLSIDLSSLTIPILGICYGMQYLASSLGGKVSIGIHREYGKTKLTILKPSDLVDGCPDHFDVWMSHGDHVTELPKGFTTLATSDHETIAMMADPKRHIYGLQFHPEVKHTAYGMKLLENFLVNIAKLDKTWSMPYFIEEKTREIKELVGDKKVICALSGGVDSSVVAALLYQILGRQLIPIFVDHGLLRLNERMEVEQAFKNHFQLELITIDAKEVFLKALEGVSDPEKKRKIIGKTFIDVFEKTTKTLGPIDFLAQGTLYTDVIESGTKTAETIKSHHNVGGLPQKMNLKLIEPLNKLFKDEVRALGLTLGLPEKLIKRQPFPGPGLAIRILGEINESKIDIVQKSDAILREEIEKNHLDQDIWQYFTILTPLKTVGVMGDQRTYEYVLALRAITSTDGMTADVSDIPYPILKRCASRIINEVSGINRVVYDITTKPPGTIEWE
ncbi:MAG: glutamine-hydrolyzing GMP synthase [Acholeplasmataceae bacterium]|jgi:GMP synthase (glutamine-hydrolysing)|nr:glutamine-hydrolyzing GMP synthase [Acholeplasmataceae bacterium]